MIKFTLFLVIAFSVPIHLLLDADKTEDCSSAQVICQLGDYHIPNLNGFGTDDDTKLSSSNMRETNSHWFLLEAETTGELQFNIVPENTQDDIDFILYESEQNSCSNREPVRIMTSGRSLGVKRAYDCIGQTGLQDFSEDENEYDGCYDIDDNYLKPITLNTTSSYYLLVNNFDSQQGFTILFKGNDGLTLKNQCGETGKESLDFEVFPNPSTEFIYLSPSSLQGTVTVQIFDHTGKLFLTKEIESFSKRIKIDVSEFPAGKYMTRLNGQNSVRLKSFIKQ